MALIIAGERSGVGKTTVTLALLASLKRRNLNVQSFKVGPDYIDPMFHQYVTGLPCRNLDPVLTNQSYPQQCFARHTQGVEYALVEGVMGLFDGVKGYGEESKPRTIHEASTAHIADLLNLPVALVIDCSRLSGSVAAIAHGYRSFDPRIKLAGVVLNRVGSDRHLELLKDALEPLNLPIVGVLRRQDDITIGDRHLGLVPTAELPQLDIIIDRLAHLGDTCFDWEQLLPLLRCKEKLQIQNPKSSLAKVGIVTGTAKTPTSRKIQNPKSKIAIARDRAFSFYYADNLDLLEELGAQLVSWSPLTDPGIPAGVQGLYFGGGFPEIFAQELSSNWSALNAVRSAIRSGMPTYAECGGLMYLCEQIVDFNGQSWPMVGVLPTTAVMGERLTLGYRQATALQDTPLLPAGATVWGHEFHRSSLSKAPATPLFEVRGYNSQSVPTQEGWQLQQVHASYVHLHFAGSPQIPSRFLQHCSLHCQGSYA
ncbi:cobyrinate a,c-diamide synthase [Argonema antarcticum]|uniref:cobyrinate a,c-diamide synthase n=1 Tax=Argonema antarcticum TaxID=2942763 RepID=UPI0020117515|nr:cobyrinate a,c-diamide synthase [Argonema antarcticum]MCL1472828.1 cobyrinate a,c-diamide synthase [Argonema antarcticum A004/B2]